MGTIQLTAEEISHQQENTDALLDQARRLEELEAENARLKRVVAVLTVDKLILQEIAEENG
jgi:hypothetical protein